MPDSFLIDGYNLIHALGFLDRSLLTKALEHSRRRLLDFLGDAFRVEAAQVTVVFDARHAPPHVSRQLTYHGLRIQFATSQQSADDLIEIMIKAHPAPHMLAVISNDTRLQTAARHRGALAWSHTDLLDYLEQRSAQHKLPSPPVEEKQAGPMTAEEKEHWMKEFGALEKDPELKEFFDMDRFDE